MNKRELYDLAKEAYYNGEEIMTDLEFDELEEELGLENKGYVGTHHQKSYTIPHPYLMGSLSKVQIKEKDDHSIDWKEFQEKILSYLRKSSGYMKGGWFFETTPKYDGCSFECVIDHKGELVSVSTRGDGDYGKDIKVWFEDEWEKNFKGKVMKYYQTKDEQSYFFLDKLVVRGECLIKKSIFKEKYAEDFTMPRSFVAGCLGQDWEDTDKQKEMRKDLSWVCYDFRETYENGTIVELDYTGHDRFGIKTELGERPGMILTNTKFEDHWLNNIYHDFEWFRKTCDYALDGFVIKPGASYRLQDGSRTRQQDCVAVKFLPEIAQTEIIDIEWNVGKTGEYYPTGILEPVILGGKSVNRVSLANYGKVVNDGLGIGAKVKISLAGDIISFLYEVVERSDNFVIPENSYVDDVHLMKIMSMEEKSYIRLLNSVKVLKPDGIGEAVATKLFELHKYDNIVSYMIGIDELKNELDDSKSSQNIINALIERKKTLNLPDLIQSMGYENCGGVNALWLAKKWSGLNPDTKGIPTSIIELSDTKEFNEDVSMFVIALDLEPMKEEKVEGKIPIIMTGSPKPAYNTKDEFLKAHPQFIETSKWGECKILFCDDLNSTSSKMEKAKKLGIEIKIYE